MTDARRIAFDIASRCTDSEYIYFQFGYEQGKKSALDYIQSRLESDEVVDAVKAGIFETIHVKFDDESCKFLNPIATTKAALQALKLTTTKGE